MEKEILMERKGNVAKFADGTAITVSPYESALYFIEGKLSVYDGDDFNADPFWIFNDKIGKARKRLFNVYAGNDGPYVWIKLLESDELARLEQRNFDIGQKLKAFYDGEWDLTLKELKRVKRAHVVPVRHLPLPGNGTIKDKIWEYEYSDYSGRDSFHFNWVPIPAKLRNVKVGKAMYEMERKWKIIGKRAWKFNVVFLLACEKHVYRNTKLGYDEMEKIILLTINGREYAFKVQRRAGFCQMDIETLPSLGEIK